MLNTLGNLLKITSFGESHGEGVGVVMDGFPGNFSLDLDDIQYELNRRKPGQSSITTSRKEKEKFEILSGVYENKTTGTPITILIRNTDQRSKDYSYLKQAYRPSHADFTYHKKYKHYDHRGGGRSSARITAGWVAAGALAKQYLAKKNIVCISYVSKVGDIVLNKNYNTLDFSCIEKNPVRCPDKIMAKKMQELILDVKKKGDTIGGIVTGIIKGVPIGLGDPVFGKIDAELAKAMLSINATKGFEIGSGFDSVEQLGSIHNDTYDSKKQLQSNHSGGVQGGITNGQDIYFNVAFKPVASILKEQGTIDYDGKFIKLKNKGRHDPCVVPRAVSIVEALSALVILDFYLLNKAY